MLFILIIRASQNFLSAASNASIKASAREHVEDLGGTEAGIPTAQAVGATREKHLLGQAPTELVSSQGALK